MDRLQPQEALERAQDYRKSLEQAPIKPQRPLSVIKSLPVPPKTSRPASVAVVESAQRVEQIYSVSQQNDDLNLVSHWRIYLNSLYIV